MNRLRAGRPALPALALIARAGMIIVAIAAASIAFLLTQPSTEVVADSDPGVTIECTAAAGVSRSGCLAWGNAILGAGPPTFTFEMNDLARLRIDRPMAGLSSSCDVRYYTSRYPNDAVWTSVIPCGGSP